MILKIYKTIINKIFNITIINIKIKIFKKRFYINSIKNKNLETQKTYAFKLIFTYLYKINIYFISILNFK
jgi:hypothetical protein